MRPATTAANPILPAIITSSCAVRPASARKETFQCAERNLLPVHKFGRHLHADFLRRAIQQSLCELPLTNGRDGSVRESAVGAVTHLHVLDRSINTDRGIEQNR